MAHIAKYKAHSVGHMLAHYRRDPSCFQRDNIDRERVGLDYTLALARNKDGKLFGVRKVDRRPNWDTVARRIERVDAAAVAAGKRRTRKDAVVLADLVITLPENVPEKDALQFFAETYAWFAKKVGVSNIMGGFVHRDEVRTGGRAGEPVRDHMHVPFTPILDGRFNYKQMVPRTFYQTLHKELGDYLERRFGYRPEISLDESKKTERVLSQVRKEDIDAARDAITASAEKRLAEVNEELGAAEMELQRRREDIAFAERGLDAAVGRQLDAEKRMAAEVERLECLRQANDGIEQRVAELESIVADARGYAGENRAGKVALISRIADAADRCASEINRGIEGVRQMISRLRERVVTTYTWNLVGGILSAEKTHQPANRVEKKFDLFSNKERGTEPSRASQDRQRVSELSRAAASWDENRSNSRGRGR